MFNFSDISIKSIESWFNKVIPNQSCNGCNNAEH